MWLSQQLIDNMKKFKLRDLFIVILFFAIISPFVLHLGSISGGNNMFSTENIIKVSLFYIIGIPLVCIIEYFLKQRGK